MYAYQRDSQFGTIGIQNLFDEEYYFITRDEKRDDPASHAMTSVRLESQNVHSTSGDAERDGRFNGCSSSRS